ncbi:MAG TPA: helix-turn-helix transcriptional regulator [Bryobacteraceae bacterium]|nr:helix-turn-helix transcriptional regulator [Bryobacteraceae bacterium]
MTGEKWSAQTILDMVERVYDAALDPEAWPRFLEALLRASGAGSAAIIPHNVQTGESRVLASANLDAASSRSYEETFGRLNPWVRRCGPSTFAGSVQTGEMVCSPAEIERSEFNQGLLRPLNLFHAIGACIARDGDTVPFCCVLRSRREGPFDEDDVRGLSALVPHMRRALQIRTRLEGAGPQARAEGAALDQLVFACLVLDRCGRVLFSNRAALEMVGEGDGLSLVDGCLCAADREDTGRLRALTHAAGLTTIGRGLHSGGPLAVARPSGRRALNLLVLPFRGSSEPGPGARPAAIVFATDPELRPAPEPEVLEGLFGLTAAESRVAAALVQGDTLESAAGRLRLSAHTVRNQLKNVFAKTGTGRQPELVSLLLAGVAQVRVDEPDSAGAAIGAPPVAAPAPASRRATTRYRSGR